MFAGIYIQSVFFYPAAINLNISEIGFLEKAFSVFSV